MEKREREIKREGEMRKIKPMKECKKCLYNENIPYIQFDNDGVCNFCREYEKMDAKYPTGDEGWEILETLAEKIKKENKKSPYDVVVGVSGGCDSSYLLHLTKSLDLNPLAVHFDNTWNSKIAVENIKKMIKELDVDLYTYVVDSDEFSDIFRSHLIASVPDIDNGSDIGLATAHYLAARKYKIKYIFEGHSFRTEGISPIGWLYMDAKYIKDIHNRFGILPMRTFPNLYMMRWLKWMIVNKIKKIRPLYYIDYDKENVKHFLSSEYDWQWYGGHHMENRISYFHNNYYLPRKFGINLKIVQYSGMIRSGILDKDVAREKLLMPEKFDVTILDEIYKRLKLSEEQFESIINQPNKTHLDYNTYKNEFEKYKWLFKLLLRADFISESFYNKYVKTYGDI